MDDRVNTARKFDQAAAAGEGALEASRAGYTTAIKNATDLNAKIVEMVRANGGVALEAATHIASAKNPTDLAQVWSAYATKQFAMLTDQARELAAVWQKFFVPPR